jgi:hypothetical protein
MSRVIIALIQPKKAFFSQNPAYFLPLLIFEEKLPALG